MKLFEGHPAKDNYSTGEPDLHFGILKAPVQSVPLREKVIDYT